MTNVCICLSAFFANEVVFACFFTGYNKCCKVLIGGAIVGIERTTERRSAKLYEPHVCTSIPLVTMM